MQSKYILASSSPRRQDLLQQIGLKFEVDPSRYEEDMTLKVEPATLVRILSRGKAAEVASRHERGIVIGADTVGVFEGEILGKPKDAADAVRMLERLAGRTHSVVSGVAVIDASGERPEDVRSVETLVTFRDLTAEEIRDYVSTGEPLDKAASYGIQGRGAALVERVDGDYFNVVGLPLATLMDMLKAF